MSFQSNFMKSEEKKKLQLIKENMTLKFENYTN